jgi:hypothetical protein
MQVSFVDSRVEKRSMVKFQLDVNNDDDPRLSEAVAKSRSLIVLPALLERCLLHCCTLASMAAVR